MQTKNYLLDMTDTVDYFATHNKIYKTFDFSDCTEIEHTVQRIQPFKTTAYYNDALRVIYIEYRYARLLLSKDCSMKVGEHIARTEHAINPKITNPQQQLSKLADLAIMRDAQDTPLLANTLDLYEVTGGEAIPTPWVKEKHSSKYSRTMDNLIRRAGTNEPFVLYVSGIYKSITRFFEYKGESNQYLYTNGTWYNIGLRTNVDSAKKLIYFAPTVLPYQRTAYIKYTK